MVVLTQADARRIASNIANGLGCLERRTEGIGRQKTESPGEAACYRGRSAQAPSREGPPRMDRIATWR